MNGRVVEKLQRTLETVDLTDYRSIPFWSWNGELDEEELIKQIVDMKTAGCGGFIMHARLGLTTEYLGEKWFSCIEACLKKAKELKMNAWIYDENGWPSGFVGGKLLETERYRAQYLTYEVRREFDETALAVYEQTPRGFQRVEKSGGRKEYHCVYLHTSPANTDILNPEVVDEFIKQTHEEYYRRFKESFGKELVGFFTDEPQYYRWATPYTRVAEKAYVQKYGENNILDNLIYLFTKDEAGYYFRIRWYTLLNELYVENFYKKLYDWCESHGCKLTGHSIEESSLPGQMLGGAGVTPTYEYEHIPAIDHLGSRAVAPLSVRQIGSAASQLGIKQVLTETFGCAGNDVTPRELKSIAESQYFNGVNLMCQHLFPYTLAGQGKQDHPPVFSRHANWWEQFREFNDYFTKLGYIIANTRETYDLLIVHPLRSVYLDYIRKDHAASVEKLQNSFAQLLTTLRQNGVRVHLADERILERHGKIENGALTIGQCRYEKVLVPKMKNISSATLSLLNKYTGGLCILGTPQYIDGVKASVDLRSNLSFAQILADTEMKFTCESPECGITSRSGELGDFIFIKNDSFNENAFVKTQGISNRYKALDLVDFSVKGITDDFVLPPHGSLILIKEENGHKAKETVRTEDITQAFQTVSVSENYLVLDYGAYSKDGKTFSVRMPLPQMFDRLLREDYKGGLFIRQSFTVKGKTPLKLVMEKGRYRYVKINGATVTLARSAFDLNFVEGDISDELRLGENILEYAVDYYQHEGVHFALFDPNATESLRNCLYYDTHIENAYLKGEFVLDKNFAIEKREALPPLTNDLKKEGYPFFSGTITLRGYYHYDGVGERVLDLDGKFLVAEVFVNGKRKDMALSAQKNITADLRTGENEIVIVLRSSIRNLFGPHHFVSEEKLTTTAPIMFTMRGRWTEAGSEYYTGEYDLVPFGIDTVKMKIITGVDKK
ncbi:MAG: hypothetical protein IJX98_06765 [Clostridia bacterium]|nr:hypothetical protein [Clostridia bacterium]